VNAMRVLSVDAPRWRLLLAGVLVVGCAWILFSRPAEGAITEGGIPSPHEGFAAPDFTLSLLDGRSVRLSDLRGQVVVVNFWASWCAPCWAEMPALQAFQDEAGARGAVVLAVNSTVQDREQAARDFASELSLTLPIALDPEGEATAAYQVRALPTTFFVDGEGVIRRVVVGGPLSRSVLETTVLDLLGEGG
jgi:cytochrome c biogenesis protein CcmG, thiol:disulfide interchange protein DsbE